MTRAIARMWTPYAIIAAAALLALAVAAQQVGWRNLFLTPDQFGRILLDRGRAAEAASVFRNPLWRGIALFRAGEFKEASQAFAASDTAEAAFDQGNALIMLGQYDDAVRRYDRALAIRPDWPDAVANREIARIRGERKKVEGGVNDDTESKPDQLVFDKTKEGGEDTTLDAAKAMSDESVRALWLKQVQTRPADFLRVKFAYQLRTDNPGAQP